MFDNTKFSNIRVKKIRSPKVNKNPLFKKEFTKTVQQLDHKQIKLEDNQLTGQIPSEIGNLTNLSSLLLNSNQLTGEIPSNICNINLILHAYNSTSK